MAKRLYVGNLKYSTTSEELRDLFAEFGAVESAQVQVDHETGRGRGFGFVVMADDVDADAAIDRLDGNDWRDRRLNVNEAQPRLDPQAVRQQRGPRPGSRPDRRDWSGSGGRR